MSRTRVSMGRFSMAEISCPSRSASGIARRLMPTRARSSLPLLFSTISWASRTRVRSISEADISLLLARSAGLRGASFMDVLAACLSQDDTRVLCLRASCGEAGWNRRQPNCEFLNFRLPCSAHQPRPQRAPDRREDQQSQGQKEYYAERQAAASFRGIQQRFGDENRLRIEARCCPLLADLLAHLALPEIVENPALVEEESQGKQGNSGGCGCCPPAQQAGDQADAGASPNGDPRWTLAAHIKHDRPGCGYRH